MNGVSKNSLLAMLAAVTMCLAVYLRPAALATKEKPIDNYAEAVAAIAKDNEDFVAIDSFSGVHNDPNFIELSRNGKEHINDCLVFLGSRSHSPDERMVAILSMHELDVEHYVIFARGLLNLYEHGDVNDPEFTTFLFPRGAFSSVPAENYNNPLVVDVLNDLLSHKLPLWSTDGIYDILSGKALEQIREFQMKCCSSGRRDCCSSGRMDCCSSGRAPK